MKQSPMTDKICLVTGAASGIGLETARGLADLGAHVIMVTRNREKGIPAKQDIVRSTRNPKVDLLTCDFSSQTQIRALAVEVNTRYNHLHVLVNNAGTFVSEFKLTEDGAEMQWGVNHLGYFLLTQLLLDKLRSSAPARIVNVASAGHYPGSINFESFTTEVGKYNGLKAYNQSKLGNVLFTYELARRLQGSHVTANTLHPGVIRTEIGNKNSTGLATLGWKMLKPFMATAEHGASTSLYLATDPEAEGVSGYYFEDCQPRKSSADSYDLQLASKVWDRSVEMTEAHSVAVATR
jgi:NAD(P)-dependent dehydrogenase (short-subunit alcohol dehydrogenase family)